MAAVIRVKRRRFQDPAENLIISYKKPRNCKHDENLAAASADIPEVENVLKFAGTFNIGDDNVANHIKEAIRKEKLQKEYKCHFPDVPDKARSLQRKITKTGRYKVVAEKRAIDLEGLNAAQDTCTEHVKCECDTFREGQSVHDCTITKSDSAACSHDKRLLTNKPVYYLYDVEAEGACREKMVQPSSLPDVITCNSVPMVREKVTKPTESKDLEAGFAEAEYVYDLYYMNKRDFDFRQLETMLSIEAYKEDYDFQEYRNNDWEEHYDDDDDSNDEDNWRNDYPNEDPMYCENGEVQDYLRAACEMGPGGSEDSDNDHEYGIRKKFQSLFAKGECSDMSSDEDHDYPILFPDLAPKISYETYKDNIKQDLDLD